MPKFLLSAVVVFCLFSFKWTIVPTAGSGLRLDDVICFCILFAFLIYTFSHGKDVLSSVNKVYLIYGVYILLCVVSSLYNAYAGRVGFFISLLYSLRGFEYWLFCLLGFYCCKSAIKIDQIFKTYVIYATVLVALQFNNIIPVVSGFSSGRAIANTGGPWEFAAVSAFFVVYFLCARNWLYFSTSLILLVLSESRITLSSIFIIIIFNYFFSAYGLKRKRLIIFACVTPPVLLALALISDLNGIAGSQLNAPSYGVGVVGRFLSIFDSSNIDAITDIVSKIPGASSSDEYNELTYSPEFLASAVSADGDASAIIRFSRWVSLFKSVIMGGDSLIIGLGPSFAGLAVDGNYTRIFAETGILGIMFFIFFACYALTYLYKRNEKQLFLYFFTLCFTALFIDVFVTYKAMLLFWFMFGYALCRRQMFRQYQQSVAIHNPVCAV